MKKNQTVNIISSSNGWHKIQFGSKTGYVHGDYVKISSTQTGNSNTNKSSKTGTVTASALNVRTGAGTSHKIIGVLKRNATITILRLKTVGIRSIWFNDRLCIRQLCESKLTL